MKNEDMKNQDYLKSWDDYAAKRPGPKPILMPIHIDINEQGEIVRERMKSPEVKKLYMNCRDEFPAYMAKAPELFDDPHAIFRDYVEYFDKIDGVQGPGVASPLDLVIPKPVWILFSLPRKNWAFSKHQQYSIEHDCDDLTRNYEKICTMDNHNALLVSNRNRSAPKGLKYNLHVTISQKSHTGAPMQTDIIIDPGSTNTPIPPFGTGN